jgi:hypothetical protein
MNIEQIKLLFEICTDIRLSKEQCKTVMHYIASLEKERDALTLKCTMLEAEFESSLDLADSICNMKTKKERLATYRQYLTTTTFETTLAKRDIEQRIDAIELLCCKLKADSFLHKETHDMAVEFTKQLRAEVDNES